MNITSKRLDKIKKTKNQSKRRIHYKNKKKNGKEKNRRKNRKYNKTTGKYKKTHKRKKRAYDLKNKSLKFKENQPVNKSATLKIITTDKPVETVQTGGAPVVPVAKDKLKKLIDRAKNAITNYHNKQDVKIDNLKDAIYDKITQDDKFKALFLILKQATVNPIEEATINKIVEKWNGTAQNDVIKTVIRVLRTKFDAMSVEEEADYEKLADIKKKFVLSIKKIEYGNDNYEFLVGDDNKTNIMRLYKLLMRYEIQSLIKQTIGWSDPRYRNFISDFEKIIKSLKEKLTQAKKDDTGAQKEAAEKAEKEEKAKNIKANIRTNELFNAFLEEAKVEKGAYSTFFNDNEENPFKNLIKSTSVMTEGNGEGEEEEGEEEEGEEPQTNDDDDDDDDDDNLVKIYDYLMKLDNQEKIRKSLTETENTAELEKFDAMIESIKYARFAEGRYTLPQRKHHPGITLLKPVTGADAAVMSTDTSGLKTTDALVDLGDFKEHVKVTRGVIEKDKEPDVKEDYVEGNDDE